MKAINDRYFPNATRVSELLRCSSLDVSHSKTRVEVGDLALVYFIYIGVAVFAFAAALLKWSPRVSKSVCLSCKPTKAVAESAVSATRKSVVQVEQMLEHTLTSIQFQLHDLRAKFESKGDAHTSPHVLYTHPPYARPHKSHLATPIESVEVVAVQQAPSPLPHHTASRTSRCAMFAQPSEQSDGSVESADIAHRV